MQAPSISKWFQWHNTYRGKSAKLLKLHEHNPVCISTDIYLQCQAKLKSSDDTDKNLHVFVTEKAKQDDNWLFWSQFIFT